MANELLDFVMSVVKNPDMAAAYAADPSQAIADAHLDGVTTADVNGLIPVVSESLSTGVASGPGDHAGGLDANVWTSGAADAAFDAFGDLGDFGDLPHQAGADGHDLAGPVIDHLSSLPDAEPGLHPLDDGPLIDDAPPLVDSGLGDLMDVPDTGLTSLDDHPSDLFGAEPVDHLDTHSSSLDIFD